MLRAADLLVRGGGLRG